MKTVIRFFIVLSHSVLLTGIFLVVGNAQNPAPSPNSVQAEVFINEAFALFRQGTLESIQAARDKFRAASELFHQAGDKKGEADTQIYLGDIAFNLAENGTAMDHYKRAYAKFVDIGDRDKQSQALSRIGDIYSDLGIKYQERLELFKQALNECCKNIDGKNRNTEIKVLIKISQIYRELGEGRIAVEYLRQALVPAQLVGDRSLEARILAEIAETYAILGDTKQFSNYGNQALSKLKQLDGDEEEQASTYTVIGKTFSVLGDDQSALLFYNLALPIMRKVESKSGVADTLYEIGSAHTKTGDYQQALSFYNQTIPLFREIGDKRSEAATLYIVMIIQNKLGNKKLAAFYGKQSVTIYQHLRSNIKSLNKSIQQTYTASIQPAYRDLADILIADSRLLEAQAVLDLLKDEEFSGLTRRGGEAAQNVPYNNAESATITIIDQIAALGREKGELAEKNEKSSLSETEKTRFLELDKQISSAEAEFRKSLDALSKISRNSQSLETVTADAQAFMEDLGQLGKGTVAIYTLLVNDSKPSADTEKPPKDVAEEPLKTGWMILVTPEFRKAYPIDIKDLEQTVFAFRKSLSSPQYDPQPLAEAMYKKLFLQTSPQQTTTLAADLDEYFKNKPEKTLMWSLDGILRYVPMAALHDGKTYLVEKYRNTIFNTASKARLKDPVKSRWTVFGLGVSRERNESGKKFPALEGAKRELKIIVKEKDSPQGILAGNIKLDEQFTQEVLFQGLLFDKNPVVHIASHFSYQPADFNESFLLTGNGKLTVNQLSAKSTLFSNVDLLTLSACETGVGGANGKDVEGFAYLAQSLGAKAVVATLWQVDDIGTQVLMPEFYSLHETGLDKAESLRQAQLALLNGKITGATTENKRAELLDSEKDNIKLPKYQINTEKPFAHPYYWSPFILIGNWK